ncbi:hypothetical protein QI297_03010 [Staphylococcus saprophyticus]|nr:hypothetical protein [Staphylococcus saprophyticus]
MNKIKSFKVKFVSKARTAKGILAFRIAIFLFSIFTFSLIFRDVSNNFSYLIEESSNTNLGVLLNALKDNWKLGLYVAFLVSGFSATILGLIASLTQLMFKKLWVKLILFSYFGVIPIVFIFTMVLLSTKPSDTTIIFSVLSAIGASIAFCFTVYMSLKR